MEPTELLGVALIVAAVFWALNQAFPRKPKKPQEPEPKKKPTPKSR